MTRPRHDPWCGVTLDETDGPALRLRAEGPSGKAVRRAIKEAIAAKYPGVAFSVSEPFRGETGWISEATAIQEVRDDD